MTNEKKKRKTNKKYYRSQLTVKKKLFREELFCLLNAD